MKWLSWLWDWWLKEQESQQQAQQTLQTQPQAQSGQTAPVYKPVENYDYNKYELTAKEKDTQPEADGDSCTENNQQVDEPIGRDIRHALSTRAGRGRE